MRLSQRLRAAPAATVLVLRALRVLIVAKRSLADGQPADQVLRAMTRTRTGAPPAAAAAAVDRAGRLVPRATCVPRAIALASLLTRTDAPLAVVLGAKRSPGGPWSAHAWVEVSGIPWFAGDAGSFGRLATYDAASQWSLTPSDNTTQR